MYRIKLKLGMLDHMNNTFRNTVFKISVDVPLKIVDFYDIPTGEVKKLVLNFFDKEKHVLHCKNLQLH